MKNKALLCLAFFVFGVMVVTTKIKSPPTNYKTINAATLPNYGTTVFADSLIDLSKGHSTFEAQTNITDTIRDTVRMTICDVSITAKSKKKSKDFNKPWTPKKKVFTPDTIPSSLPKKVEFDTLYVSKPVLVIPILETDTIAQ